MFETSELGTGGQARSLGEVDSEAQGVAAMRLNKPPEAVSVNATIIGESETLAEWAAAERDEEARKAQARG